MYSAWGLLSMCAACPTPLLNQSYELRPPWEQHLRYVPHRVRNGYNKTYVVNCCSCLSRISDNRMAHNWLFGMILFSAVTWQFVQ